jgi:hypothetical protein
MQHEEDPSAPSGATRHVPDDTSAPGEGGDAVSHAPNALLSMPTPLGGGSMADGAVAIPTLALDETLFAAGAGSDDAPANEANENDNVAPE